MRALCLACYLGARLRIQFRQHGDAPSIGWVIIATMKLFELLVCQLWNDLWITATIRCIVVIWEQILLDLAVVHTVRLAVHAFHLVEDDALVLHVTVNGIQLVVPSFLLKDLRVLETSGMEHGIQVYISQVVEVLQQRDVSGRQR